jgi:exonuclease SbcC
MRIRKLRLFNLNSIQGKVEIDFTQPPLSDTGLFAIVGDTGAGKSTLLDAITLALYGRIHRSNTYKEVMSYGTAECWAELEFEVREDLYMARWGIHRAYNKPEGNLQNPIRRLNKWDSNENQFLTIAQKSGDVDEAVEKATGLDFDRFCRSVLLSQGDFAAFLKAKPNERGDLLERITGTDIYSGLSQAAFERHRIEKETLERLVREQELLKVLTPEEVENLQTQELNVQKNVQELQKQQKELQQQLQQTDRLINLQSSQKILTSELEQLKQKWVSSEAIRTKLKEYQKALPLQGLIERSDQLSKSLQELAENIEQKEQWVPTAELQLADKKESQEKKKAAFNKFRKGLPEEFSKLDRVVRLDHVIEEATREVAATEKELEATIAQQKSLTTSQQDIRKKLDLQQKKWDELEQWSAQHRAVGQLVSTWSGLREKAQQFLQLRQEVRTSTQQNQTLQAEQSSLEKQKIESSEKIKNQELKVADLKQKIKEKRPHWMAESLADLRLLQQQELAEWQERKERVRQIHELRKDYARIVQQYAEYEEKRRNLEQEEMIIGRSVLQDLQDLEGARAHLATRRRMWEQQQQIANYAKDRAQLQPGEPCPLCLSEDHPFHEHPELLVPFEDTARQDFETAEQEVRRLELRHQQHLRAQETVFVKLQQLLGDATGSVKGQLASHADELAAYEKRLSGLFQSLWPSHSASEVPTDMDDLDDRLRSLEKESSELMETVKSWEKEAVQLQELQTTFQELKQQIDSLQKIQAVRNERLGIAQQEIKDLEKDLQATLKTAGKSWDPQTIQSVIIDLEVQINEWESTESQKGMVQKEIEELRQQEAINRERTENNQQQQKDRQQRLTVLKNKLSQSQKERKALFGTKDPQAYREQLQQTADQLQEEVGALEQQTKELSFQIKQTRQSLQEWRESHEDQQEKQRQLSQDLHANMQSAGFEDLESVRRALQPDLVPQEAEQEMQALQEQRVRLEDRMEQQQVELNKLEALSLDPAKRNVLAQNLAQEEEEIEGLQKRLGAIRRDLEFHAQQQKTAGKLIKKIEKQRKEFRRWDDLNQLIGSKEGNKFRVFAQGLTLEKLTHLANRHLVRLNDRYFIHKMEDKDLELEIRDTFQADHRRSMNTLSGGESFLVSLALALGLSDMAGRHTEIRSLFIDEGFGSLDLNSLDDALTTLENLQASGKTIGIISHVKELKERISVQVQLVKKGSGISTVRVEG